MSMFSVQARKHTAYYDYLLSTSKTPGKERKATDTTLGKSDISTGESVCADRRSSGKIRQVNRTYVVSALSKSGGAQQTPHRARLTLQRRSRRKTEAETADKTMTESSQTTTPAPEKRLTLQRRTRTPSMDKNAQTPKVLSEQNGRTPALFRSMSLRESVPESKGMASLVETQGRLVHNKTPSSSASSSIGKPLDEQAQTFKTPTKKTPFEKIAARRDVFERLAGKELPKPVSGKSASLEVPKSRAQQTDDTKPVPAPRVSKAGVHKPNTALRVRQASTSIQKGNVTQARASTSDPSPTELLSRPSEALKQRDSFKMENSAVTVAVRVRPFNARFVV